MARHKIDASKMLQTVKKYVPRVINERQPDCFTHHWRHIKSVNIVNETNCCLECSDQCSESHHFGHCAECLQLTSASLPCLEWGTLTKCVLHLLLLSCLVHCPSLVSSSEPHPSRWPLSSSSSASRANSPIDVHQHHHRSNSNDFDSNKQALVGVGLREQPAANHSHWSSLHRHQFHHSHYRQASPPSPEQQHPDIERHKRYLSGQSSAPHHWSTPLLKHSNVDHHHQTHHWQPLPLSPNYDFQSDQSMPAATPMMYGHAHQMPPLPPLQILPIENVTASVGRNAMLKCVINRPGQYKVAWLKMDDNSEPTLLTLGLNALVSEDEGKYKVTHNERQWWLHVNRVQVHDRGRYMCQINAKTMTSQTGYLDVHEPPVINEELTSSDTNVDERQKVSLRCATSGYPSPSVSWRRENGKSLNLGLYGGKKFAANKWDGEYLNISQVVREDMGAYLCIAANGVPPSVSKRIVLQVNFSPKIRVAAQLVSAYVGSDVELECRVEASPKPETFWLAGSGQKLNELMEQWEVEQQKAMQSNVSSDEVTIDVATGSGNNHFIRTNVNGQSRLMANHHAQSKRKKYQFEEDSDGYKTVMRLTIRRLESVDFGSYKCVAKNSMGEKEGMARLYEIPVPTLPPTTTTSTTVRVRVQLDRTNHQQQNPSKTDKWTKSSHTGSINDVDYPNGPNSRSLRENQKLSSDKSSLQPFDDEEDDSDEDSYNNYLDQVNQRYNKNLKSRKAESNGAISCRALHLTFLAPVLPVLALAFFMW